MRITREKQLEVIDRFANSRDVRFWRLGKEGRRERAQCVCNRVAQLVNSDAAMTREELRTDALATYDAKFGSDTVFGSLLMILAFQVIWYLVQKLILDELFTTERP